MEENGGGLDDIGSLISVDDICDAVKNEAGLRGMVGV